MVLVGVDDITQLGDGLTVYEEVSGFVVPALHDPNTTVPYLSLPNTEGRDFDDWSFMLLVTGKTDSRIHDIKGIVFPVDRESDLISLNLILTHFERTEGSGVTRVELGEILLGRTTEVDMSGLLSTGDLRLDGEILRGGEVVKQYVDEIFLDDLREKRNKRMVESDLKGGKYKKR